MNSNIAQIGEAHHSPQHQASCRVLRVLSDTHQAIKRSEHVAQEHEDF